MNIVFDMDNTLADEMGGSVRPGIIELLNQLISENHFLCLYTNSTKQRAIFILNQLNLRQYFSKFVFREDYDPDNIGLKKNISMISGDILIDDDPSEIEFTKSQKKTAFLISPFRKNSKPDEKELIELYQKILRSDNIFRRIFK
jgi:hydroxymethylpyrimidine pyrophosphatase-like HAD family hydrolase